MFTSVIIFGRPSGRSRPPWPPWRNGGCWAPWSPRPPRSTRGNLSRYESPGFYKPGLLHPHPHQRFSTLAETEIPSGVSQKHRGLCLPQSKNVGLSDGGTQASAIIKMPRISNAQPGLEQLNSNQLITYLEEVQAPGLNLRNIQSRSQGSGEEYVCMTGFPQENRLQTRSETAARVRVFLPVFPPSRRALPLDI